jgi:membrane protein
VQRRDVRRVARSVLADARESGLMTHASAIAFRALVATLPLTVLGFAILGATGLGDTWRDSLAPGVRKKVTPEVFRGIDSTVERIVRHGDAGLIAFATALSLWYLAMAVLSLSEAFNAIHGTKERRPMPRKVALAFGLAAATGACLVSAVLVLVLFPRAVDSGFLVVVLGLGRWAVAVAFLMLAVGLLVRYAPAEHPDARWASAGSVLVVGVWIVATLLFKLWVVYVANFKSPTGVLAMLLVLTGYLFVTSTILLVGVQVDEELRKGGRSRR